MKATNKTNAQLKSAFTTYKRLKRALPKQWLLQSGIWVSILSKDYGLLSKAETP